MHFALATVLMRQQREAHSAAANVVGDIERDCNMVCPELETARERYARQAQAFHAEREKDGTAPPAELPYNVRMLPFWEAVSAAEAELDAALANMAGEGQASMEEWLATLGEKAPGLKAALDGDFDAATGSLSKFRSCEAQLGVSACLAHARPDSYLEKCPCAC